MFNRIRGNVRSLDCCGGGGGCCWDGCADAVGALLAGAFAAVFDLTETVGLRDEVKVRSSRSAGAVLTRDGPRCWSSFWLDWDEENGAASVFKVDGAMML